MTGHLTTSRTAKSLFGRSLAKAVTAEVATTRPAAWNAAPSPSVPAAKPEHVQGLPQSDKPRVEPVGPRISSAMPQPIERDAQMIIERIRVNGRPQRRGKESEHRDDGQG